MAKEEAAQEEKNALLSERVKKEKEELLSATPRIDIDRLKFQLEVYQEAQGEPPIIRRAKLFYKLCAEKPIFIDGNPIVGTLTEYKYGSYFIPEANFSWVKKEKEFALQRGIATRITQEEREWIDKAADYWAGKSMYGRTKEALIQSHGVDISVWGKYGVGLEFAGHPSGPTVPDYATLLAKGLNGLVAEIEEEKANLDLGSPEGVSKWYFYRASSLCLNGMMLLSQRYASLAEKMAKGEENPERKRELEKIAQACHWVPANPAQNFYEAIQSVWFAILGIWLETPAGGFASPVRFSQYMYPFYKKDKEEGKITDEEVVELVQFFFLKLNQLATIMSPYYWSWNQSRLSLQLSLGGLTPDGQDATNELDYLVLEAQERIRLPEPLVGLLYHDKLSEDFLLKCVNLIRTGIGQPAFHNLPVAIERHLFHHKMSLEEARSVSIAGCVQSMLPGYTDGYWEASLNIAKMLELALNDGKDPLSGVQLGPQIGAIETFKTYNDFYHAVIKQLEYFIPMSRVISRVGWNIARDFPVPFGSALVGDCIKQGKDQADGGARYSFADGVSMVGVIDAANSLAAIKKLVFEEKRITLSQLKEALDADFEGYEEVERWCLGAPKYGNDDESVDSIAKELYRVCDQEHQKFPDYLGKPIVPSAYSVTKHYALGKLTGALPNGRKARVPLCDASVSAQPGTDKNGPTALVKSAAKAIDNVRYSGNHFNMKFHPTALKGLDGARKFLSLIKTYFDLGGYHVQFNCVSGETLRDAQLHPENYRELIVRVAGFSAYFIHLDREVQEEIISRTEFKF